jgi:hypothetical protein
MRRISGASAVDWWALELGECQDGGWDRDFLPSPRHTCFRDRPAVLISFTATKELPLLHAGRAIIAYHEVLSRRPTASNTRLADLYQGLTEQLLGSLAVWIRMIAYDPDWGIDLCGAERLGNAALAGRGYRDGTSVTQTLDPTESKQQPHWIGIKAAGYRLGHLFVTCAALKRFAIRQCWFLGRVQERDRYSPLRTEGPRPGTRKSKSHPSSACKTLRMNRFR